MLNLLTFTKEARQSLAEQWLYHLEDSYLDEIEESQKSTWFVPERIALNGISDSNEYTTFKEPASIYIVPMDTVSCIFRHKENEADDIPTGVLNFASFKHPGGMFRNGSSAQEEALCHHSTLIYSLTTMMEQFYIPHMKKLNEGLYNSDAIMSQNVTFVDRTLEDVADDRTKVNVITMAAPNLGVYIRRGHDRYDDMYLNELNNRIIGVLNVAALYDNWDLILGAFGCGVFKNNPDDVADLFFDYLTSKNDKFDFCHKFRKVFFAIPKSYKNNNYQIFCEIGKEYGVKVLKEY